ncbi:MAG TPA: hypothetical protein V6D23_19670, partial [Candidatus Obscuribacterales bacterium]
MSSNLGLATGELQHMEVQTTAVGGESLWKEALKRLLRDKVAITGGVVILLLVAVAVLAPVISPHNPNKQYDNGTSSFGGPLPIGSHGKMLSIELASAPDRTYTVPSTLNYATDDGKYVYTTRNNITFEAGQKQVKVEVNPQQSEMATSPDALSVKPRGDDLSLLSIPIASASLNNSQNFFFGTDA